MRKTFQLSFMLKNTYRVNSILYALKQIPILKRILPDTLYQESALKVIGNVIAGIWELITVFLGKLLYLLIMVFGTSRLYQTGAREELYLHILLCLTCIGVYTNTKMFDPSKDKYYAIILLRMDAKEYTIVNYLYAICKTIVGFLPFSILFGWQSNVPIWLCLFLPFSIAGAKVASAAYTLWNYDRRSNVYNENKLSKLLWAMMAALILAAYVLPMLGMVLPKVVSIGAYVVFFSAGLAGVKMIFSFTHYKEMQKELLSEVNNQIDPIKQAQLDQSRKAISLDQGIQSSKQGFEYLNDLFMRRHKKVLWGPSKKIAAVCAVLSVAVIVVLTFVPEAKEPVNRVILSFLPYFAFIMYLINRGTNFTQVLFMNCDHSLLTYSFFKQPNMILKLFRIRLREIVKVNLLPAVVIGGELAILLYVSGGTDQPLHYVVVFVSILCMSGFFSIHYLTIYYLLQPYNAGTEMKSGMYRIIMIVTYMICYFMMQLRMPTMLFGLLCIAFCVVYSIVASILVYRFAPRTFRLRP